MKALVGSAAIHVVLGAALLSLEIERGDRSTTSTIAIEVIAPRELSPQVDVPTDVQGGGASRSIASQPTPSPAKQAGRKKPRIAQREHPNGELAIDRAHEVDCARGQRDDRGALDPCAGAGREVDGDGGEGDGVGGHRGSGIGFGDGGRIVLAEQQFALPEAPAAVVPPPSKARPAKLIYPTRERDLGEEKLFVARVTVDTDGYVVGAKLVKGSSGPRDAEAADLIFRFRYAPALDHSGRAIASTFEQPFHVNR